MGVRPRRDYGCVSEGDTGGGDGEEGGECHVYDHEWVGREAEAQCDDSWCAGGCDGEGGCGVSHGGVSAVQGEGEWGGEESAC